jgi:hypothetical protein
MEPFTFASSSELHVPVGVKVWVMTMLFVSTDMEVLTTVPVAIAWMDMRSRWRIPHCSRDPICDIAAAT